MPLTKVRMGGVDSITDDKLSNNIATLNGTQTFTGEKTFNADMVMGSTATIKDLVISSSTSAIGSGDLNSWSAWGTQYNSYYDSGTNIPAGTYTAFVSATTHQYSHIDYMRMYTSFSFDGGTTDHINMDMVSGGVRNGRGNDGANSYPVWNSFNTQITTTGGNYKCRLQGYGGDFNLAYYGVTNPVMYATYWNRGYVATNTFIRLIKIRD
tara:strand:+ start:37 stop:666 length:630 start_codon:yes stop_codon:yes gene_type:complete